MVDPDNEGKLKEILKEIYKPATASPKFKKHLRKRLIATAGKRPKSQPL